MLASETATSAKLISLSKPRASGLFPSLLWEGASVPEVVLLQLESSFQHEKENLEGCQRTRPRQRRCWGRRCKLRMKRRSIGRGGLVVLEVETAVVMLAWAVLTNEVDDINECCKPGDRHDAS